MRKRMICLPYACNAQHLSFVGQEHDIHDYFQVILQTPVHIMGYALKCCRLDVT